MDKSPKPVPIDPAFHTVVPDRPGAALKSRRRKVGAPAARRLARAVRDAYSAFLTAAAELTAAESAAAESDLPAGIQPSTATLLAAMRGGQ